MNFLYAVIYLIVTFSITLITYKYLGKVGLYIWICLSIVISNIQSVKIVEMFGLVTVLGNVAYSNIYLSTDILTEKYGSKSANKSVLFGFITMLIFSALMCFSLVFIPSAIDSSQGSLKQIFSIVPRITAASLIAYLVSQFLDVFIYSKLKKKFNKVWLSNNVGTITSQIIDTIIFVTIAYVGTVPAKELFVMMGTMYLLKVIIAILDTGFIYIAKIIKPNEIEKIVDEPQKAIEVNNAAPKPITTTEENITNNEKGNNDGHNL